MKLVEFSILIIISSLLFSCKNNKNSIALKGDISNLENPEILISYFADDTLAIDTVMSDKHGKFIYKNTIDTLTVFSLYFNNQSSSVMVFANPKDKISIKGDAQLSDLINVNGNEINDDLTQFKESNKELLQRRTLLLHNLKEEKDSNLASNNRILANTDEIAKINSFNQELALNAEEQVKKNPTKMSSLILINEFFANSENPKGLSRVIEYMQGDILKSKMGLNLKAYSEKINRSAEGTSMPYFRLVDKSGDTIQSYDYQGKYLLLSFISTTGIDSRETVKSLRQTYRTVNKDSVKFISIYIDSDMYPVSYIENDSIPWTVVPEKKSWASDIVEAYNIEFIPNNILISPAGIISDRNVPAIAVENALKNSVKNNH
ncbi:Thiol-disulfide oxidoreductase ResA [bioreactor metagenome]|uniref:Thiol-disulfide oxidoreductase ResA n=1 Tax=bioreactor metagenome TaxID=1076179 RepID=A0A644ZBU1_9ZZZZ